MKASYGTTVKMLSFTNDMKPHINNELLKNILEHPDVKDRKVVVLTVAGTFSKEKDDFLNCCLNILYSRVSFNV